MRFPGASAGIRDRPICSGAESGSVGTGWYLCLTLLLVAALLQAARVTAEPSGPPGIRILVVKSEAEARDAVAAYTAGVPFDRLVRERSIGPARERGGYLGRLDAASLPPAAQTALAITSRGGVSPIFAIESGFAVIQVVTTGEEEELEARIRQEPEARALFQRGTELGKDGDLEAAESFLRQAIDLNPGLADAHFNLAIVLWKRGSLEAAIATMRSLTQLYPGDFEAQLQLGAWLFEQRLYPESCQAFERAATLQLDSREAWLGLARSYEAAGKAKAAVGAYRQLLTLVGQDDPGLYESWLRVAMQAKDGPTAVEAARKVQALRPGHQGFLALGQALLLNGEANAAVQEFQKAVALAPTSATARAGLASAYAKAGETQAAVEAYLQAIRLEPGNPSHYRTLARLYAGEGRLDLAIVALRDGVAAAAAASRELQAAMSEELAALYDQAGMSREAEQERFRARSLRSP